MKQDYLTFLDQTHHDSHDGICEGATSISVN